MSEPLTLLFLSFQFLVSSLAWYFSWDKKTRDQVPTLFTMMGICLTFIGIVYSLALFDQNDIDASIGELISGLYLAFGSSILGVGFAIAYRSLLIRKKNKEAEADADETKDLQDIMIGLSKNIDSIAHSSDSSVKLQNELNNEMKEVAKSICGEADSSLFTQLQKVRISISDLDSNNIKSHDRLYDAYERYAEKMAEYNAKALAEQFAELIRDFNNKISEQFGENFARLNDAVGKMLEWQDAYQRQLDDLKEQLKVTAEVTSITSSKMEEVVHNAENFSSVANHLESLIGNLNAQNDLLRNQINDLSEVGDKAKESLPGVFEAVEALTERFSQATNDSIQAMSSSWESNQSSVNQMWESHRSFVVSQNDTITETVSSTNNQMKETLSEVSNQLNSTVENVSNTIKIMTDETMSALEEKVLNATSEMKIGSENSLSMVQEIQKEIKDTFEESVSEIKDAAQLQLSNLTNANTTAQANIEKLVSNSANNAERLLREQVRELGDRLVTQTDEFDKALQGELNKCLESLGSNLAALSGKFVEDYGPITNQVKQLIESLDATDGKARN